MIERQSRSEKNDNPLEGPNMSLAHPELIQREPEYIEWGYLGEISIFFFPPGSKKEHLVTEHGIPSINLIGQLNIIERHELDHGRQEEVLDHGAVADLLVEGHRIEEGFSEADISKDGR